MGSHREVLKARSIEELRRKWGEAVRKARATGLGPDAGFREEAVKQTPEGFEIMFVASS
jgi:hypothetical protein